MRTNVSTSDVFNILFVRVLHFYPNWSRQLNIRVCALLISVYFIYWCCVYGAKWKGVKAVRVNIDVCSSDASCAHVNRYCKSKSHYLSMIAESVGNWLSSSVPAPVERAFFSVYY